MSESGGIVGSARRVFAHGAALLRLERELAKAEMQRKAGALGGGVLTALAAALFAVFAIGFGLAAVAAALALVVDWWLALLIVFAFLVLVVAGLAFASRSLFRAGTPLKPEQAIAEAQATKDALRSARGN